MNTELPNEILSSIYGTGGHEKTASPFTGEAVTLSDLALALVTDGSEEGEDLEKVASEADSVLNQLVEADRAGRAMAHHEFGEMEKSAAEGDSSALEAFYAEAEPASEVSGKKQAILNELARRHG